MMRRVDRQAGFGVLGILLVALVAAALAATGVFVWQQEHRTEPTKNGTSQSSKVQTRPDPYAGWKTYASSAEKLTFRYPTDWTSNDLTGEQSLKDALRLKSPSGALTISWFSTINGLGGACDTTIMPGTAVAAGALGPCPYWYVLDKQKLAGADLYYVAGVETADGSTYSPWCALQPPNGMVTSKSNIGYLLFRGKNNDFQDNGHDYGLQQAGLVCGNTYGDFGVQGLATGTKAQATAFLSTPEFQQAKLILVSASY